MIPQDALKTLARSYGVSDTELEVLSLAIEGRSLDAIAKQLQIRPDATRKRLGEVYRKFEITGSGPGKLAKLQTKLQKILASHSTQIGVNELSATSDLDQFQPLPRPKYRDWGEAIDDLRGFYGRESDLAQLHHAIVTERCQLVAILGIGGIGKTALSLKLAKDVEDEFDYVIWRSLKNAIPIQDLLADLIRFLSQNHSIDLPITLQGRITLLSNYLRQYRCLIVLDNVETILQSEALVGQYREGYEGYGELFERIGRGRLGETPSQSCLLLTSREKPIELSGLAEIDLPVQLHHLEGLNESDAKKILEIKGFTGTEAGLDQLIEIYRGNPLALKIVSTTIQELFGGNIREFLSQSTTVFGEIRSLLAEQFDRLSELEKNIMYWLAIDRDWVTLPDLRGDMVPLPSPPALLEALESLGRRSLIEKNTVGFQQQPVVVEYVTEQFVECICHEICTGEISLFNSHALIKAKAQDYIRHTQIRFILEPIVNQLLSQIGTVERVEYHLRKILMALQDSPMLKPGYAGGNILNLLVQMEVDLEGYDFSDLTVWQAYLQNVDLHRVNFTHADLSKSVFAETLSSILAVCFSPVGDWMAIGEASGKVRLYNSEGELFICEGHMGWVRSVSFSADGELLASAGDDRIIRLWNVRTGQCLKTLSGHTDLIRSVCFAPQSLLLASGGDDRTVKLWNVETGQCVTTLTGHEGRVLSVAFSPDEQQLASGNSDRTIRLWDVQTGKNSAIFRGHSAKIWTVAFSPDGLHLVSGGADKTVRLWDRQTGDCRWVVRDHIKAVLSVCFSPDGSVVASSSDDQTVKLWRAKTGQAIATLEGHTCRVWSLSYSPDGQIVASGSDDQTIKLWDVNSRECRQTLQGHTRGIRAVGFSPDGQTLASGGEDQLIRLWDLSDARLTAIRNQYSYPVQKVLRGHLSRIWSLSFSPDGQLLASGSDDRTIKLWQCPTGFCSRTLFEISQEHADWIRAVTFSPNGEILASGTDDTTISLWNVATGELLRRLQGHEQSSWVWSVAFSPDGAMLASSSSDCTIRLWQVNTAECLSILRGHSDTVFSVAFSPDGKTLASGSRDHSIKLWDVETVRCLQTLQEHTSWVRSVAFSPDGTWLASGSNDQTVKLWNLKTGGCRTLTGHTDRVRSIAFSPDGRWLASGSGDASIRLWEVETEQCHTVLKVRSPYEGMNITGAKGLTTSHRATLIALGAIDQGL
ncbi:WD40 domain-containing protein [Thermocoleostomius sinensis]|uniref:NB-ARC domain-containing protein n=1 Tax=Thermocoleostomius sinensis A174 TaxID=2016057 RepID=A0A9E8ZJD8_9CYAN|nr:NB-ARC domain-containing protein [Thermocoleostomius sinensis]WAL62333.1 NB-ARC domain-containing protein [Thermocoleostomius sinensis A174]